MNTDFLIKYKLARKAENARDAARQIGDIISSPNELRQFRQNMSSLTRHRAAFEIAKKVICLVRDNASI